MAKNPSCSAGDLGLISDRGTKIPHPVGQLSLCATTREICVPQLKALYDATKIVHATTKT